MGCGDLQLISPAEGPIGVAVTAGVGLRGRVEVKSKGPVLPSSSMELFVFFSFSFGMLASRKISFLALKTF